MPATIFSFSIKVTPKAELFVHSFKMSSIKIPEDLELQALTQFDRLVSQGRFFFEDTEGEVIDDRGFKVSEHGSIPFSS